MAYTTIKKPSDYFNTKLYTGTGSTLNITGLDFQPDWNWTKNRSTVGGYSHNLCDVIRGTTKYLKSNSTGAEQTGSDRITSFNSDGYTLGTDANQEHNFSGHTYVSWNWKANGAGSANTDGSISSTVSANTTSGFSIVSYTGNGTGNSTVGHGLGAIPKFMIVKKRDGAEGWGTLTASYVSAADPNILYLNNNAGEADDTNVWGTSANFTSSTFTVGTWNGSNANASTYICYCFAEVQGFSKFGKYTGNGNAEGPFIYTGFKPAFLMVRGTALNSEWVMLDNKREPSNDGNYSALFANLTNAEGSYILDILSNGFKVRNTSGSFNTSGGTYTYMAFAEEPLVGDNPATAR